MPYKRVGKCVTKEGGKSVGCSKSVGMAKQHMKALYANVKDAKKK